ncbi:Bifunctional lysine-specific demethylase and histidyl-hydroxylase [Quillaja saponaria]|uniref:Bifunctional lysine-specific demethylase and histidyl-hydroxylase n=1 Tax=Quillaja saponaria TaxID=32244 RepID=A0AAD7Q0S2_QUISA|nr:Bifunctional lysine-specific demethylase and histidyl-hydroxylase [Quillaja saponaria]
MDAAVPDDLDDYSPSSTITNFDRPIQLLRGPILAGSSEDPSACPYVLAFRDAQAWASAYRACESKITAQCEDGARIGCAINATVKCKPPWWQAMMGGKVLDLKERETCEERETTNCFGVAKEKCNGFAKDKCLRSFRDARIAMNGIRLNSKEATKLICWASTPQRNLWVNLIGLKQIARKVRTLGMTNYRATELLCYDDFVECILGEGGSKELSVLNK